MTRSTPPRVLTIAGSDSGGGAGIQADLKTFDAHGVYGMSVITALTAQNTREVRAVHAVPPAMVAAQIDAVFDDIGVDAVKIGMLADTAIVDTVAERLAAHRPAVVVLDPVMVAKSGAALLADDAVAAVVERLMPLASVVDRHFIVTPNLPEAARLAGDTDEPTDEAGRLALALRLATGLPDHAAVLLKGGHAEGDEVVDLLVTGGGDQHRFVHPRIDSANTHGTGCTLSSAVASRLARGEALVDAVGGAIDYLHGAIQAAFPLGSGHGPVNHLYRSSEFSKRDV
ncbi:MAG: bifunctional hydroxymethylpyrimidine kinase/phosphomethylpyrimidine kinase [Acidobacteriota bacterium]